MVTAIKTVGGYRRVLRSSLMLKIPASQTLVDPTELRLGRRRDDAKYAKSKHTQRADTLSVLIVEDDAATTALLEATLAANAPQQVTSRSEYKHMLLIAISGLSERETEARNGLPTNVLFFPKPLVLSRIRGFADAHLQLLRHQLALA